MIITVSLVGLTAIVGYIIGRVQGTQREIRRLREHTRAIDDLLCGLVEEEEEDVVHRDQVPLGP